MNIDHTHFRQALQRTPFHDRYAAMSTTEHWATWNTYKVPYVVDKLSTEYFSVRSGSRPWRNTGSRVRMHSPTSTDF
jgi:hypothetical protein